MAVARADGKKRRAQALPPVEEAYKEVELIVAIYNSAAPSDEALPVELMSYDAMAAKFRIDAKLKMPARGILAAGRMYLVTRAGRYYSVFGLVEGGRAVADLIRAKEIVEKSVRTIQ